MARRDSAITDPSVNPVKTKPPGTRLRALEGDGAPEARRFSPLDAPQREAIEAFCGEAGRWAQRQAKRTYGHLPEDMRLQAIERAMRELRLGAPPVVDRTTLYATFADELTDQLRQVHAGWCLNAAQAQWRKEGPVAVPAESDARATAQAVGSFVESGLGGLERAVLQMEIGAGRDTRTSRAALRLGPREYERHRSEGLSKLRSAINGHAAGRVCEDHRDAVILAATGDADALHQLSSGPGRCRACAREAAGLRRVLQERLAVAPWPLAIKPAGLVAAKVGMAGAMVGGKSAGTAGLGTAATAVGPFSTSGAIAILATAAIATGTVATLGDDEAERTTRVATPAAAPATTTTATPARERATAAAQAKGGAKAKAQRKPKAKRRSTAGAPAASQPAVTSTPADTASTGGETTQPAAPTGTSAPSVQDTAGGAVDEVRKTVDPVTTTLPPPLQQPVDETLDTVEDTVDDVSGTVDGLLP